MVDNKGSTKGELECKRHKRGKFGLGMSSREASVFEASKRGLTETGCVDMVSVDLDALEIGAVLLLERSREIQGGIESCAAVIVFAYLQMKSCKPSNGCTSCLDLSARKVKGKLRDVSFWYVDPRMAETCEDLVTVSETSDLSHDVPSLLGTKVPKCVRTTREVERNWSWNQTESSSCQSRLFAQCSDEWDERQFRFVLITFGAGTDRGQDEHDCKVRVHEVPAARKTVSPAG